MLELATGAIDLWLVDYDEVNDEQLLASYRELLNDAERAQEKRFYFARDQRRYLVTRALVRTALSRYGSVAPRDWVFTNNHYGRPAIANETQINSGLSFNISHTHSLIVLGVTRHCALGVDVENVVAREVSIDIARRFFAPDEVSALEKVLLEQQRYRFFEYWTFKESYIKARGMGLSIPLDKFSFHFPHSRGVTFNTHSDLADDAGRWKFWQFRPREEYLVAVCAERAAMDTPRVMQVVPLLSDKILAPTILRTSE